jgi:ABC-type sugar transport system substrate-binding protein
MQRFRTTTRRSRGAKIALTALSAGAAVMIAACSSSSSSTAATGGSAASQGTSTGGGDTGTSSANISALSAAVTKAAALPQFSDYASGYGGKLASTAALKGKKIMIVPGSSALAACTEIAQATSAIATASGMVPTIFQNQGTTAEHNTAIENAIHQGYAAVALGCDYDPTTNAPAIAAAQKAGLVVSVYGATQAEATAAKLTYVSSDPYTLDATLAVDQAVSQHNGQPFQAIAITSNAASATLPMQTAMKAELAKQCPKCTLTETNVEVPQWSTNIASSVSSALLQNPNVTVLFPDYAGMMTYVLQGIQSAHKTSSVKAYLNFGGGTPFVKIQTASPGKDIVQSDIGGYPPWTGYLLFLQTARALEKQPAISYAQAYGPNRIVTPDNAVEVLTTGGWGTSWVNGFRELLGLPDLSGAALASAATLNGAMVDKP